MTQSRLKKLVRYDYKTGIFTSLKQRGSKKVGSVVGTKSIYIQTTIDYNQYYLHRLAWLYSYGYMPVEIDHINHDKHDNRLSNLREVNKSENGSNRPLQSNNISGTHGVGMHRGRWRARIMVNQKEITLYNGSDKNEAICARLHANKLYSFHKNHGKD